MNTSVTTPTANDVVAIVFSSAGSSVQGIVVYLAYGKTHFKVANLDQACCETLVSVRYMITIND